MKSHSEGGREGVETSVTMFDLGGIQNMTSL